MKANSVTTAAIVPSYQNRTFTQWVGGLDDRNSAILSQNLYNLSQFNSNQPFSFQNALLNTNLNYDELQEISAIMNEYSISFLGGANSKNFLVTNLITGQKEVLKLETRFGNPLAQTEQLKRQLKGTAYANTIVPTSGNKEVMIYTLNHQNQYVPEKRILQMTEYCQGNDLQTRAANCINDVDRLTQANSIYSQMSGLLIIMNNNGAAHTDPKNSNWLLNIQGELQINDTKAVVPAQGGMFSESTLAAQGYGLCSTYYLNPPEFSQNNAIITTNEAASFMLGKNIYEFLATDHFIKNHQANEPMWQYLENHSDGKALDYSAPVFQTFEGRRYQLLIQETVKPNANQRLSLEQVQQFLQTIQALRNNPQIYTDFSRNITGLANACYYHPGIKVAIDNYSAQFNNPRADIGQLQQVNSILADYNDTYQQCLALNNRLRAQYANNPEVLKNLDPLIYNLDNSPVPLSRLKDLNNTLTTYGTYLDNKQKEYHLANQVNQRPPPAPVVPIVNKEPIPAPAPKSPVITIETAPKHETSQPKDDKIKQTKSNSKEAMKEKLQTFKEEATANIQSLKDRLKNFRNHHNNKNVEPTLESDRPGLKNK